MELVEINHYIINKQHPCYTSLNDGITKSYVNTEFVSSLSELIMSKRLGSGKHFIEYSELKMNNGDVFHIDKESFEKFV